MKENSILNNLAVGNEIDMHEENNEDEPFQLTLNDKIDDILGDVKSEFLKYVRDNNLDLLEYYNSYIFEQSIRSIVE